MSPTDTSRLAARPCPTIIPAGRTPDKSSPLTMMDTSSKKACSAVRVDRFGKERKGGFSVADKSAQQPARATVRTSGRSRSDFSAEVSEERRKLSRSACPWSWNPLLAMSIWPSPDRIVPSLVAQNIHSMKPPARMSAAIPNVTDAIATATRCLLRDTLHKASVLL